MSTSEGGGDGFEFRQVLPIFVVVFIDLLGLTIIIPFLPLYAASFGATPFTIGALIAVYPVAQFIGAPVLGRLSDRHGRKPILIFSQIGTCAGFVILAFAGNVWVLFLSRLIDGLSGANISTAQAVITDHTTPQNRSRGLGLIGAAFGIGFIVGPIIAYASLIWSGNDYRVPALIAAGFSLASIFLTTFWLKESAKTERKDASPLRSFIPHGGVIAALRRPEIGVLLALLFLQQFAFGGLEQLIVLFTLSRLGLDASGNAILFVFVGIIIVAVQGKLIGTWTNRWGEQRLIVAGLALVGAGLFLVASTPAVAVPWYRGMGSEVASLQGHPIPIKLPTGSARGWIGLVWVFAALVPASVGGGLLQPSINSLLTRRIDQSETGGILGIGSSLVSAANALGPLAGGALFQFFGAPAPFWTWGFLTALCVIPARKVGKIGAAGKGSSIDRQRFGASERQ